MSQQTHTLLNETDALDQRHALISSRRVEGTPVYSRAEKRLGAIHSVMIDKQSGQVAYAVLSLRGLIGLSERVHPLPWEMLHYDVDLDAYVIDASSEELQQAPTLRLDRADRPQPRDYEEVAGYYERLPWWGL
jgi:hypothetical protein